MLRLIWQCEKWRIVCLPLSSKRDISPRVDYHFKEGCSLLTVRDTAKYLFQSFKEKKHKVKFFSLFPSVSFHSKRCSLMRILYPSSYIIIKEASHATSPAHFPRGACQGIHLWIWSPFSQNLESLFNQADGLNTNLFSHPSLSYWSMTMNHLILITFYYLLFTTHLWSYASSSVGRATTNSTFDLSPFVKCLVLATLSSIGWAKTIFAGDFEDGQEHGAGLYTVSLGCLCSTSLWRFVMFRTKMTFCECCLSSNEFSPCDFDPKSLAWGVLSILYTACSLSQLCWLGRAAQSKRDTYSLSVLLIVGISKPIGTTLFCEILFWIFPIFLALSHDTSLLNVPRSSVSLHESLFCNVSSFLVSSFESPLENVHRFVAFLTQAGWPSCHRWKLTEKWCGWLVGGWRSLRRTFHGRKAAWSRGQVMAGWREVLSIYLHSFAKPLHLSWFPSVACSSLSLPFWLPLL